MLYGLDCNLICQDGQAFEQALQHVCQSSLTNIYFKNRMQDEECDPLKNMFLQMLACG